MEEKLRDVYLGLRWNTDGVRVLFRELKLGNVHCVLDTFFVLIHQKRGLQKIVYQKFFTSSFNKRKLGLLILMFDM